MNRNDAIDLLHKGGHTNLQKLLIISYYLGSMPSTLTKIKAAAIDLGLPEVTKWNLSRYFLKAKPRFVRFKDGWVLSGTARKELETQFDAKVSQTPVQKQAIELRKHLNDIKDADSKSFIIEAIACSETEPPLYRASVVLSWVGAVSILHRYVYNQELSLFEAEMLRRKQQFPDWKGARSLDQLGAIKESTFLDIIESIGIIGSNVKKELKNCLDLRNGCGHPSSLKFSHNRVAAHLEILIENVFKTFSV